MSLCENNIIDENILYWTTGITRTNSGTLRKATDSSAKLFSNMNCRYNYLLRKTYKLPPEQLKECNINYIPIRIVQATGNTYLSRITAMLNLILDPVIRKYCQIKLNECCKDFKN